LFPTDLSENEESAAIVAETQSGGKPTDASGIALIRRASVLRVLRVSVVNLLWAGFHHGDTDSTEKNSNTYLITTQLSQI
jgi:hypothetical protein